MSAGSQKARSVMPQIVRRVRAYVAPVQREPVAPAVFDPARDGRFELNAPPAPWIDLGWIHNFRRSAGSEVQELRGGSKGEVRAQVRRKLGARVEFEFLEWGKLQLALCGGSQSMNLLQPEANSERRGSGGLPELNSAVPVLPGSTAQQIILGVGAVDAFETGDVVAVDVDYQQQAGYVGSGITAAWVKSPADVGFDPDYVRRVTFNVGRVAQRTTTALLLAAPLAGGAPAAGALAQRVLGFVDREGGSFWQEWSGLFVAESESGGRVCFYYPRLRPGAAAEEQESSVSEGFAMLGLRCRLTALPAVDPNDGERVVCYRSYLPAPNSALW